LGGPLHLGGDGAKVVFGDRITARTNRRQVKNRLLEVWREVKQVHNLRNAGAGDVANRGEIGLR